ncbi:MAG: ABC transporter substrate-binding protein [Methylophilales bacterium]|nr:ABC transporter substrate-binding protein [Methylophilales bacterium]
MNIRELGIMLPALLVLLLSSGVNADTMSPDAMVQNTANEVLEILKSNKDVKNGDMNKMGKLVEAKIATKFDFDRMSGLMLGQAWSSASKQQQDQFTFEFRSLLVRTYSSALSKYRDQTIEYKPLQSGAGDSDVKVKTQIVQPSGTPIPLDYRLGKIEDNWKVYDVIIDGVSLVTMYRGQFSEEVKLNGLNGLIQRLSDKNKQSL